jgi:hypothetical protein
MCANAPSLRVFYLHYFTTPKTPSQRSTITATSTLWERVTFWKRPSHSTSGYLSQPHVSKHGAIVPTSATFDGEEKPEDIEMGRIHAATHDVQTLSPVRSWKIWQRKA